jgi:hypothetical protein
VFDFEPLVPRFESCEHVIHQFVFNYIYIYYIYNRVGLAHLDLVRVFRLTQMVNQQSPTDGLVFLFFFQKKKKDV